MGRLMGWVRSNHYKSNKLWPNQDYSPPSMSGWVDGWVNKCGYVKSTKYINLDLIEIIQFCLKIYDLLRHPTYRCAHGWAHVKSLKIDLELIAIIWFWKLYLNHLSSLQGYFYDLFYRALGHGSLSPLDLLLEQGAVAICFDQNYT